MVNRNNEIVDFVVDNSWFFYDGDEDRDDIVEEEFLCFRTRENGCVGEEEPGDVDISEAKRIGMEVSQKYNTITDWDTTDEWTNFTVHVKKPFKNK